MVEIATAVASPATSVVGATAAFGVPLITDEDQLATARDAVVALAADIAPDVRGIIVSAFGDPGLHDLKRLLAVPVTGIAESAFLEASQSGEAFAVVTTTPKLVVAIGRMVDRMGLAERFVGTFLTEGDAAEITNDPQRLPGALGRASQHALAAGARSIVIGGGPLAVAARAIAGTLPVPVIEPIPAAVRHIERRLGLDVTR